MDQAAQEELERRVLALQHPRGETENESDDEA